MFIGYGPHDREDCLNIGENLSQAGSNGVKKLTEILYAESIQHHAAGCCTRGKCFYILCWFQHLVPNIGLIRFLWLSWMTCVDIMFCV